MEHKKADPNIQTMKCPYNPQDKSKEPHFHQNFVPIRPKICSNIQEAVGYTPIVRFNKIPQSYGLDCEFLAKCEYMNPGGSMKDRIAFRMLEEGERDGRFKPGDTIVEASSGNTGIGLSMACAIRGYNLIVTLSDRMSKEKSDTMKVLGATVVRCPAEASYDSPESYIGYAHKLEHDKGFPFLD